MQPYNSEVGAGTYNPATFLRALGPEPWNVAFVEPSRRPSDGRYGDNPNRAAAVPPVPGDPEAGAARHPGSVPRVAARARHASPSEHDVRFVEDDWESPTLGAWGLGWQVWLDGLEISQFTYFQQVGGIDCQPVSGELTYGLERIAMYLQDVDSIYDVGLRARASATARSAKRAEWEWSTYNFEQADVPAHFAAFDHYEKEAKRLLALGGEGDKRDPMKASCSPPTTSS